MGLTGMDWIDGEAMKRLGENNRRMGAKKEIKRGWGCGGRKGGKGEEEVVRGEEEI